MYFDEFPDMMSYRFGKLTDKIWGISFKRVTATISIFVRKSCFNVAVASDRKCCKFNIFTPEFCLPEMVTNL